MTQLWYLSCWLTGQAGIRIVSEV